MWDKRKPLLAAIIVTALYCKVTAKELDMARDAADAQYTECHQKALMSIRSGLLEQELNHTEGFQKAWRNDKECDPKLIPGGIKEHTDALGAYLNGDKSFIKSFNKATETLGGNVSTYENDFHFKSLYFLLTDSIRLLNSKPCKTVYAVKNEKYNPIQGSDVGLGQFTKVYTTFKELEDNEDLSDVVLLNITSCFSANLGGICKGEDMALLSPAEVFTVEKVDTTSDGDESTYTKIVLKHSRLESSHKCYIFSRSPADVSTQWLVLALVALSLFFINY